MPKKGSPKKTPAARRAEKIKPLVEGENVEDYRHQDKRKNIPSSGQADYDTTPVEKKTYKYSPHLDPQLEWAGKAERLSFDVDTVSLHIHERISTQAILRAIRSKAVQRTLFNDPSEDLKPGQRIEFYKHDMGWTNRLILGDSLVVMNSLLERENMSGKVQMIYIDPPYGVKFNSNFQPTTASLEVKDGDDDSLTREPEMIRAYRDTWELGIHSYLTYLRDRVMLARELLAETGSCFVQISDENVHFVRNLMDEVFGPTNLVAQITVQKTTSATGRNLGGVADYVIWYAKDAQQAKYRPLYKFKELGGEGAGHYTMIELPDGSRRSMTPDERRDPSRLPKGSRPFTPDNLQSASVGREKGLGAASWFPVKVNGKEYLPNAKSRWKTNEEGMSRLLAARRVLAQDTALRYVRYFDDFPVYALNNIWADLGGASDRVYVVQTNTAIVQRCMLMTTDPGDIVLDPTCGSGTTAFMAETWGRRWITLDTSRVAIAIARERILTARFPFFELQNPTLGVRGGFVYETVPHVTLKSIAQAADEPPVTLFDRPAESRDLVRVSGPFTTEAIPKFTLAGSGGNSAPLNAEKSVARGHFTTSSGRS